MRKIRVFINGFGRIGRSALRVMLDDDAFDIVGINDIFPVSQYRYLLQFDSVHGTLSEPVAFEEGSLLVGRHRIRLFCEAEPSRLDLSGLKIDVLLQCSGVFLTVPSNEPYLRQGVGKVVLSAPARDDMPTYVRGFNHLDYRGEAILSNSSCSSNAIAPILQTLEGHCGITHAGISMIHSYTADQNLLDGKHTTDELRRARSATQNILPLHSTATAVLCDLFPRLGGRLYTKSIRVPLHATTLYDFTLFTERPTDRETLNALLSADSRGRLHGIVDADDSLKVSSDYIGNRHGATVDLSLTEVLDGRCVKLTAWQDSEYGYASQLVQLAKQIV